MPEEYLKDAIKHSYAASARKEKDDASDDDIERAIRELEHYGVTYGLS